MALGRISFRAVQKCACKKHYYAKNQNHALSVQSINPQLFISHFGVCIYMACSAPELMENRGTQHQGCMGSEAHHARVFSEIIYLKYL